MKINQKYIFYIVIFVIVVLCLLNRRTITFEAMIAAYKLYSLYGSIAWNNKYPIDYPYDRVDLIPDKYMKQFNHICYYRQLTGNNQYKMEEMRTLIKKIEGYCKKNLPIQTPKQLTVLYPFDSEDDNIKMKTFIQNKYPFVIRGGKWKTNKSTVNIENIIQKYSETTVLFDKDNETFTGKLKDILNHKAYLSNSTSFMKKHPEIIHKDDYETLEKMTNMKPTIAQMFMSLIPNNGTPMHSAFSHNFFFMVEGQKKWTFWHPDYLCFTYPYFPESGIYFGSASGIRDLTDPNIRSQFRLLQYAPSYEIILKEGDVLFNPGPWWHAIKNISEKSLAFATRWVYNDIFPSQNQLQYCQITNPNVYKIFREIYKNTGELKFDVDENYKGEIKETAISLIELLNHDSLKMLLNKARFREWHESFANMFQRCKTT